MCVCLYLWIPTCIIYIYILNNSYHTTTMDLARTIRHVESFRVPRPRPPYNNDIMRWGEKNYSPRSYFISPQLTMFTNGTFRACNRISRCVLLYYFRQKTRRALVAAIRCFSLLPRNMIEFSTRALSRDSPSSTRKAANCFRTWKISTKDVEGRGFLAGVGVLRTLRMSSVQGQREKRNLGESSNNGSRGNRVKWETYSLCRKKNYTHNIQRI